MPKQTLFIISECNLTLSACSLVITYPNTDCLRRPLEDIEAIVIDHHSVHITIPLLNALSANGISVVICNENHMPVSMLQMLDSNYIQDHRFHSQLTARQTLKKQLWQQIIIAKIRNQSGLLTKIGCGDDPLKLYYANVKYGDTTNREGLAAKVYWHSLFGKEFLRDRFGDAPNNMLNFGYAILRANVAKALMGAGLLPAQGIFHHNCYNAFPLADDLMEPFRPFIDEIVYELFKDGICEINRLVKSEIISIFYNQLSFNAIRESANSLVRCYEGESKILVFPSIQ